MTQSIIYGQDARICKQHYTVNYQSEHQLLVEVYKDVETSILRGYMVAQLAYMILGLRDRGKFFKGNTKKKKNSLPIFSIRLF